jgi:hypothetical protein
MIETYAFLGMFTIQILTGSAVGPTLFIRRVRRDAASFPVERYWELPFPDVDPKLAAERFAMRHGALNAGIAVLGLLLLGWLFTHMRRPDWGLGTELVLPIVYFLVQTFPAVLMGWKGARSMKVLKSSLADGKRKAVLQRRGLFDFISPFSVFLAVLSYFLFGALVLYSVRQHLYSGLFGLIDIGVITLVYAFNAFMVFGFLYGRKRNPLQTHADRVRGIGMVVQNLVRACIGVSLFQCLYSGLLLAHLFRWCPFAVSALLVIAALPPRRPKQDEFGSDKPLPCGTREHDKNANSCA